MADYVIADNEAAGVAVIVDVDEFRPLAVVAAGEARVTLLRAFIDSTPFDIGFMDAGTQRAAFNDFLVRMAEPDAEAESDTENPVVEVGGDEGNAAAALATAGAYSATTTPEPAPADTDAVVEPPMGVVTVRCWNCNGAGVIDFGDGGERQSCNMCGGTGQVQQQQAPAAE